MRARFAIVWLGLVGCGRIGFDPGAPAGDAAVDAPADAGLGVLVQRGLLKASNPGLADYFGHAVAISADRSTLVVGARFEDSAATTIDGDQTSNAASDAGAAYVFVRAGASWTQQAYLKPDDARADAEFGFRVRLSDDGHTLLVGAFLDGGTGAAYVFVRAGATWSQQAKLVASNAVSGASFGCDVALAADGSTAVVGAYGRNGGAGGAYVFTRTTNVWTEQTRLVAPNAEADDNFGDAVALSRDGQVIAIAAPREDGGATSVGGDPLDNTAPSAGAVFVYRRTGEAWSPPTYLKASDSTAGLIFGNTLTLGRDGSRLAIGAVGRAGSAGGAYVFMNDAGTWREEATLIAAPADPADEAGWAVALSDDGAIAIVGARSEDSAATGVDGDPLDNSLDTAGAAYAFVRTGTSWQQHAYLKPADTAAGLDFGASAAIAGTTIVIGAHGETSSEGAVYVFE